MSSNLPTEQTKCEWCGADYDPSTRPPERPRERSNPTRVAGGEPITHCEWCGAEYPTPDRDT